MGYYDSISAGYEELYREEQLNKLSIIKSGINIGKGSKLLDIGCGTGISSGFNCFVVGVDPSINLLKQNSSNRKLFGIAESLPFKDGSFDYVVSVTAMHNFDSIKKSIKEIKRVCKGKFVLSALKSSRKFSCIKKAIEKNFKIEKVIEESKDVIFFCASL